MGQSSRFGAPTATVEVGGEEYAFRALKVRELEQLVNDYQEEDEQVLTAAIIATSSDDGKLADLTVDELREWPMVVMQRIQKVVQTLNGLGAPEGGN